MERYKASGTGRDLYMAPHIPAPHSGKSSFSPVAPASRQQNLGPRTDPMPKSMSSGSGRDGYMRYPDAPSGPRTGVSSFSANEPKARCASFFVSLFVG